MPATGREVACELAGPALDAVAHVLAHVACDVQAPPLVRASSLHDARYVAWAEATLDPAATVPIQRDAALLGALLGRAREGPLLQALLVLHDEPGALRRGGRVDLEALAAGRDVAAGAVVAGHDVAAADPWALRTLQTLARQDPALVEIA